LRGKWKPVGGGDKQTQKRDIEVAHGYWQDYQERTGKHSVPRG
jgi:hypothetical protein